MSTINPSAPSAGAAVHSSGAQPAESECTDAAKLLRLIWGIHISRAVYAAAELGVADLLAEGPVSTEELARVTRTHEPSLYRVLRLLAALGVLDERYPRCFGLTALGGRLRSGKPAGMRSWATFLDAVGGVRPFGHILDTVKTGRPGFDAVFGMGIFDFLAEHPENAATFDAAMSERTAAFAPSVAGGCDFSDMRTVVDVGGGQGTLLAEILRKHGHLHGVLLETPAVAGRVLIIERLIPEDGSDAVPTLLSDINMLVITGGRERTNDEYSKLLRSAGLKLGSIQPAAFPYGVIEGLAA